MGRSSLFSPSLPLPFLGLAAARLDSFPFGIISPERSRPFSFFALLQITDEFKDAEEDAAHRPYRAVPRGLVSLRELRITGFAILGIILFLNTAFLPRMLPAVVLVLGYMGLMTAEFFVPKWLKARPLAYLATHMMIVPFFNFYTTGLNWITVRRSPPGRSYSFFW